MGKPKSFLKGQQLTPDNHHPNTPLEWDESLHLHKKVTVGDKGKILPYLSFLIGLILVAGISFVDDIHSLPDSVRLVVQFVATGLMGQGAWFVELAWYWKVVIGLVALIVFVGATDVINFMDGINGITAGYSLAVLVPLLLANRSFASLRMTEGGRRDMWLYR